MPEKRTLKRARQDKREGKSASTQAGEFVHEEIEHIREGKHGARSTKQAIAIGLSKARRAGVDLPPPKPGEAPEETRRKARRDIEAGSRRTRKTAAKKAAPKKAASRTTAAKKTAAKKTSPRKTAAGGAVSKTRSRATTKALKREGKAAVSKSSLSKQAKTASRKRTASERSAAAKKAARTKGAKGRSEAARKAARTRARHEGGRTKHGGATAHA